MVSTASAQTTKKPERQPDVMYERYSLYSTAGMHTAKRFGLPRILEVNTRDRYAVVEPGVVNVWLTNALKPHGLHYAPDPPRALQEVARVLALPERPSKARQVRRTLALVLGGVAIAAILMFALAEIVDGLRSGNSFVANGDLIDVTKHVLEIDPNWMVRRWAVRTLGAVGAPGHRMVVAPTPSGQYSALPSP